MSITFEIEIDGHTEPLNFSNFNAAALMALAGLPSSAWGEVEGDQLARCVRRLLQAVNSESVRLATVAHEAEAPRWSEGGRTDDYVQRRAQELLVLFVAAQRQACRVRWG